MGAIDLKDRFLRACRCEQVDRPPVWIMRQAGRYLPEYREIRKGKTMMESITTPDIATEITLQPLCRFPLDAAILFSDLTIPFTPMGAPFDLKEGVGPVVHEPVRHGADLSRLRILEPKQDLPFVFETIAQLKRELKVPLIGFTGAPFTLASYLVEGGPSRDLKHTRALMYTAPEVWHQLMAILAESVAAYLVAQLDQGADAVQLFDSWVGNLDEASYREFLLPHMKLIFDKLAATGKPVIHFGTGNPALLPVMAEAGGDVLGVDWRISLTEAARRVAQSKTKDTRHDLFDSNSSPTLAFQGNLDPILLLCGGPRLAPMVRKIVEEGRQLPGHIFNLGHGVLPDTPIGHVEEMLSVVTESVTERCGQPAAKL